MIVVDEPALGALLAKLVMLSSGHYVLIRSGWNQERARFEWRVSIRRGGQDWMTTAATLPLCLERAVAQATARKEEGT